MHATSKIVRHKNRWQLKRMRGIAASRRMIAGKMRLRLERPPPQYPPIIDSSTPFLRINIETATGTERWAIYPGKKRAHRVEVNGSPWVVAGRKRHSVSAVSAHIRKQMAMTERSLRLPSGEDVYG